MVSSSVFPLIFLLPLLSSAVEFWNIDCGATDSYTTAINLTWLGDGNYVRAGESRRIPTITTDTGPFLTTLRVFPKNKKNCYLIPTGTGKKVMVTVRFYYNNYDGLNKPPSFELMFEGMDWIKVLTSNNPDFVDTYDVIYVTKRENTSVCFGRTNADQDPFVTSISLRTLDPEVYAEVNSSYALSSPRRYALGANQSIRFPDDKYDRTWNTISTTMNISSYTLVRSNATAIYTSRSIDNPPSKMFRNAIVPERGMRNLTITTSFIPAVFQPFYLNLYFSEVSNLVGSKEKRSFHIYMDDKLISKEFGPITPPFGNVLEFSNATLVGAKNNTRLTFVPTADSTLPPLINGLEVLFIWVFRNEETNRIDGNALTKLQDNFASLQEWTGDPCLPQGYSWDWVGCSADETPRITKLSLGSYGLSGSLPDFSELTALEVIDLHNNSLSGSIPEFLSILPNLRELNLADNKFDNIPVSLSKIKRIKLNITGNPALEVSAPPPPPLQPPPLQGTSSVGEPPNGRIGAINAPTLLVHLLLLVIVIAT